MVPMVLSRCTIAVGGSGGDRSSYLRRWLTAVPRWIAKKTETACTVRRNFFFFKIDCCRGNWDVGRTENQQFSRASVSSGTRRSRNIMWCLKSRKKKEKKEAGENHSHTHTHSHTENRIFFFLYFFFRLESIVDRGKKQNDRIIYYQSTTDGRGRQ